MRRLQQLQRIPRWKRDRPPRPFANDVPKGHGRNNLDREFFGYGDPPPPAPLRSTYAGGSAPEGGVSVRLAGFNFQPRGATVLDELSQFVIQAQPTSLVTEQLHTAIVPYGWQLRLQTLSFFVDEMRAARLLWSLVLLPNPGTNVAESTVYTQRPVSFAFPPGYPLDYNIPGGVGWGIQLQLLPTTLIPIYLVAGWLRVRGYLFMEAPDHIERQEL